MLSIIIPTLNEEQHIEKLLHQLEAQKSLSFEIIVSDGGSADATLKIAKNMGAIIVSGEPGRGCSDRRLPGDQGLAGGLCRQDPAIDAGC